MKQMLVLTLFQCKVSDFFTMASKNFDTGTNDFLVKTPFTWCHTGSFNRKLSDHDPTLQLNLNISSKFGKAKDTNTCCNSFSMDRQ